MGGLEYLFFECSIVAKGGVHDLCERKTTDTTIGGSRIGGAYASSCESALQLSSCRRACERRRTDSHGDILVERRVRLASACEFTPGRADGVSHQRTACEKGPFRWCALASPTGRPTRKRPDVTWLSHCKRPANR